MTTRAKNGYKKLGPEKFDGNSIQILMNHYLYIALAILGYGCAFFFLSMAVRTIPIGIANALTILYLNIGRQ
jgi:hypothetical protein